MKNHNNKKHTYKLFSFSAFQLNKGFTITELLVTFTVISILSGGLIFYSRTAERQIILFKEQAKIIGIIQKAKNLSFATYAQATVPCGYGAYFQQELNRIILFQDISPSMDLNCSDVDNLYTASLSSEKIEEIFLDKTVKFSELGVYNIVFIPPNPKVILDNDISKNEGLIKISTIDNLMERVIKITNAGQITTQ